MNLDPVSMILCAGMVAAGGVAGWWLARGRMRPLETELERSRQTAQDQAAQILALTGQLESQRAQAARIPQLEEELSRHEAQRLELTQQTAQLRTALEAQEQAAAEKQALLDQAQQKLSDAFQSLAAQALSRNNASFLELAQQNMARLQEAAKGDLDRRHEAFAQMLTPLREQLKQYEVHLREMENLRQQAYGQLVTQVGHLDQTQKQLEQQTGKLVQALRSPKARGRWGEITLRNTAELAGMIQHCDFEEQVSVEAGAGRLQPDMIVNMPGGHKIVVDAKTPFDAFYQALDASDEATRDVQLQGHAKLVRAHMRDLSQKAYWEQFENSPEFVVMFIPGESFLAAAVEKDPSLVEDGFKQRVVLATPSTLFSLLRTVAGGWRQEQLTQSARQVSQLGAELYDRMRVMFEHMTKLGASLSSSVGHYNKLVGAVETRIMPSVRRFPALGVEIKSAIDKEPEQIEALPRQLSVAEAAETTQDEDSETEAINSEETNTQE